VYLQGVLRLTVGRICADEDRLTLGLMGLDELHLRVLATSSEDLTEKKNAQKGALSYVFDASLG
jgi:hypothetical protein